LPVTRDPLRTVQQLDVSAIAHHAIVAKSQTHFVEFTRVTPVFEKSTPAFL